MSSKISFNNRLFKVLTQVEGSSQNSLFALIFVVKKLIKYSNEN